jgi:hypothetical protein
MKANLKRFLPAVTGLMAAALALQAGMRWMA